MATPTHHDSAEPSGDAKRKPAGRAHEPAHGHEAAPHSRAAAVRALQRQVGNRATARLLGVDGAAPARGHGATGASASIRRVFSVRHEDGEFSNTLAPEVLSDLRLAFRDNLGEIEQADPDDYNGVYGNYLENSGVFDSYAQRLFDASKDFGLFDLRSPYDSVRLYFALKEYVMRDITEIGPGIQDVKEEHPEWASAMDGILPGQGDAAKMATLIANFKKNAMGFSYSGASKEWSLAGDCGSVVRTFAEIANRTLQVDPEVTTDYHNGGNGWFLPAGFSNIATNRGTPNVEGGPWYYKASHVWAVWGGTVYDVLFGEIGQHGFEPEEAGYRIGPDGKAWHFRVGSQWYRSDLVSNAYVKTEAPQAPPQRQRGIRTLF